MRILVACLLTATAGLLLPQSSRDLRSRFGEPDIERYTATNDIGLTVQYGSEGLVCQILIERKRPLLSSSKAPEYMPPETVSALLDDVVPPESRGRHLNSLSESMGCSVGRADEYENVWIARYTNLCVPLKPERESSATVAFKRPVCPLSPYAQLHN
jgi:hypothetical protein